MRSPLGRLHFTVADSEACLRTISSGDGLIQRAPVSRGDGGDGEESPDDTRDEVTRLHGSYGGCDDERSMPRCGGGVARRSVVESARYIAMTLRA